MMVVARVLVLGCRAVRVGVGVGVGVGVLKVGVGVDGIRVADDGDAGEGGDLLSFFVLGGRS